MTAASEDTTVSESGGTMTRLTGPAAPREVDLALLESERSVGAGWAAAGRASYGSHGDVLLWHYGRSTDPVRVVRDDERGLVAWLAEDTEQLLWWPADGRKMREVPLAERYLVPRAPVVRRWQGSGVLRIAPTGRPWSVWLFWEDDGTFAGHYVNLELPHTRRDGETATRDLTLDLWVEPSGETWLKDADELDAAVACGHYSRELADEVLAAAEWARADLVEARDWPLDVEWTTWRPPAGWAAPPLPDTEDVRAARARTLPS